MFLHRKYSIKWTRLPLSLLVLLPVLSFADGTATIDAKGKHYRVEFANQHVRVESPERPELHLIARDDTLYTVTAVNGRPVVMEGRAILNVLAALGIANATDYHPDDLAQVEGLRPMQREESIAGIQGHVYTLDYLTRNGQRRSMEIALTKNPDIVELTHTVGKLALAFQHSAGVDTRGIQQLVEALQQRGLGLLRAGNDFRLAALDVTPPSPERFTLPAAPIAIPGLDTLLSGFRR